MKVFYKSLTFNNDDKPDLFKWKNFVETIQIKLVCLKQRPMRKSGLTPKTIEYTCNPRLNMINELFLIYLKKFEYGILRIK